MTRFEYAMQSVDDMAVMVSFCIAAYVEQCGIPFKDEELMEFMTETSEDVRKWLCDEMGESK